MNAEGFLKVIREFFSSDCCCVSSHPRLFQTHVFNPEQSVTQILVITLNK